MSSLARVAAAAASVAVALAINNGKGVTPPMGWCVARRLPAPASAPRRAPPFAHSRAPVTLPLNAKGARGTCKSLLLPFSPSLLSRSHAHAHAA